VIQKGKVLTLEEFFCGGVLSRQLFEVLLEQVKCFEPIEYRVTKSQIAFRRNKPFAWAWMPGKYLHGKVAPLVLSVSLQYKDLSPRWKTIVEPAHGRFIHHLELYSTSDIDDEVKEWLRSAWLATA
jgi:hypothetical protein